MFGRLLDFFFPPKCVFCRKLIDSNTRCWCEACISNVPFLKEENAKTLLDGNYFCRSAVKYDGIVRESFLRYKFSGYKNYAEAYAQIILNQIDDIKGIGYDAITWSPISKMRRRKRGYDQSRLIAESLAKSLNIPYVQLLVKTKHTKAQSLMTTSKDRADNVRGVYKYNNRIKGKYDRVLLLDDIITTGSTMNECIRILNEKNIYDIECISFAKAGHN